MANKPNKQANSQKASKKWWQKHVLLPIKNGPQMCYGWLVFFNICHCYGYHLFCHSIQFQLKLDRQRILLEIMMPNNTTTFCFSGNLKYVRTYILNVCTSAVIQILYVYIQMSNFILCIYT